MFLKAAIFTFFMSVALLSQAHEPAVGNRVASTEIRVRIPSYAIIQLAKNSSKTTVESAIPNFEKKAKLKDPAQAFVISNQKWGLHVETLPGLSEIKNSPQSSRDSTIQVIYTTSPQ